MSNDFVPASFRNMKGGTHKDVENAAQALLDETNKAFGDIGISVSMGEQPRQYICTGCSNVIAGRLLKALDGAWHPACFECSQCARPINNDGYTLKGDDVWCMKCVKWSSGNMVPNEDEYKQPAQNSVAPKSLSTKVKVQNTVYKKQEFDTMNGFQRKQCCKCNTNILTGVDYNDSSFCLECFKCIQCHQCIDPSEGFLPQNDHVVCKNCAGTTKETKSSSTSCSGCNQPIAGKFVRVDGNPWHKECFKCQECSESLSGGYAMMSDKYVCGKCAEKLMRTSSSTSTRITSNPTGGIRVDPRSGKVTKLDPVVKNFCNECGSKWSLGSKFCSECGAKGV